MVRRGWAIEFKRYSDGRYADAETVAAAAKAGLRSVKFDEPAEWRKAKRVGEVLAAPSVAQSFTPPVGLMAAGGSSVAAKEPPTTSATSCKSARTCGEAVILWCGGYSRVDADVDGIPCGNVWRILAQVEPMNKAIGCEK